MGEQFEDLRLTVTMGGSHIRLTATGELDSLSATRLREELDAIASTGPGHIEIDLSGITFCNAAGAAVVACAHDRMQADGRTLRIANPSRAVTRILQLLALQHPRTADSS